MVTAVGEFFTFDITNMTNDSAVLVLESDEDVTVYNLRVYESLADSVLPQVFNITPGSAITEITLNLLPAG